MRLYVKYFAIHLKSQMQYKASFAMTFIGNFFVSFSVFLGIHFMFLRFDTVAGFTYEQVLLCFAAVLMSFCLAELFARGFDLFPSMIGNGEFDRIMVRPRGPIFQVLATKIDFTRIGRIFTAMVVLAYAIPNSGVLWSPAKIAVLAMMIICGALIFFGLFLIYAALSFFTLEGLEFMNIFTHGGQDFGRYPFAVYGEGILKFLTFVVPFALVQYYPLTFLLGMNQSPLRALSPLLSLIFLPICYGIFRFGLRRYKSTGS